MLKSLTPAQMKLLLTPLAVCIALILLGLFGGNFVKGKVAELQDEEKALRTENARLSEKVNILQDFQLQSEDLSKRISIAVPSDNPGLASISQIRLTSAIFAVAPEEIDISKSIGLPDRASQVGVNFGVRGSVGQILSFLEGLSSTAPFGRLQNVKITRNDNEFSSTITYNVFWSELPATIPQVTDPIAPFTDEDRDIIQALASLEAPDLSGEVAPQGKSTRVDPFGI